MNRILSAIVLVSTLVLVLACENPYEAIAADIPAPVYDYEAKTITFTIDDNDVRKKAHKLNILNTAGALVKTFEDAVKNDENKTVMFTEVNLTVGSEYHYYLYDNKSVVIVSGTFTVEE